MIYLIGFMGSGKSLVGKKIARELEWKFLDTDELIEEREEKKIREIFRNEGEHRFREIEREVLRGITPKQKMLVSCGGGTPCFFDNMKWMKQHGSVLYLKVEEKILMERLIRERKKKALLEDKTLVQIKSYVVRTLRMRMPFYHKADKIFELNGSRISARVMDELMENVVAMEKEK